MRYPRKLFGLTIKPDRLQQIRNERKPDSRYSSAAQVAFEVRAAESLFERHGVPVLDATEVSIEEISTQNSRPHGHRASTAPLKSQSCVV